MTTNSFTDTYVINREDVKRFHNIINSKNNVKITKVMDHKDVKSKKSIRNMLGLKKDDL